MPHTRLITASFIGFTAFSTPLFADITGAQVWADWKAYMQSFNYDLTATESQSGDTLTVTGISMNMTLPEASFEVSMPNITFTDTGSGTVAVTLPETFPIRFDAKPEKGEAVSASLNLYTDITDDDRVRRRK